MTEGSPQESEYNQFCREVGKLILGFGNLENALTICLQWHLKYSMMIGKFDHASALASAVYGSMRYKASRDTIKRILKVERAQSELCDFLSQAFGHVGHIEEVRDKIAHQAIIDPKESHTGQWEAWDIFTTRDLQNDKVWSFSSSAVAAAADDVHALVDRLSKYLDTLNDEPSSGLFANLDISPISWKYNASMLKNLTLNERRNPKQ